MCASDTDPHGSAHRFSWASLQCCSGMSQSFSGSMPRSTSQVSWWRQIFISKNLHLLIRHRRHQTASTSQDEGKALRYPLQKKRPSRRTQELAEEGSVEPGGLGGGRSAVPAGPGGLGRGGAPGCPRGGGAASQGGTSETSYLAAICILMVPPAVLPDCFTGRKGNRKTQNPPIKNGKEASTCMGALMEE